MERTIRVTGKGKLSVKPDMIRLRISIEGIYEEYDETLRKSSDCVEILKNLIEKMGLLAAAVKDSQAKASVLTEEAGVNLGKIITIDYSWGEIDFVSRPLQEMSFRCCEPEECESASYDMDIEPDDIDISDTVTVIWGLED